MSVVSTPTHTPVHSVACAQIQEPPDGRLRGTSLSTQQAGKLTRVAAVPGLDSIAESPTRSARRRSSRPRSGAEDELQRREQAQLIHYSA
jgi:hypothetical protein